MQSCIRQDPQTASNYILLGASISNSQMTLISGPYDGRKARRRRCDYCVKRQIKVQVYALLP